MKKKPAENRTLELLATHASWLVPLVIYMATISPGVMVGDAGEFIVAAHKFSLPHSPGYPLYVLLLKIWSALPIGIGPDDPFAVKCNLFSAIAMAAACGIFYRIIRTLSGSAAASIAATLALAFSRTLWKFAVVAEVYALHVFLIMLVLAGLVIAREGKKPIGLVLTSLGFGLGLAHHHTILFLVPLVFVLWPKTQFKGKKIPVAGIIAGIILPLVFYLFLPVLAKQTPQYAESGFSAKDFAKTITRAEFRQRADDVAVPEEQRIQAGDIVVRIMSWLPKQFGWFAFLVSAAGFLFAPAGKRTWALMGAITVIIWIAMISFFSRGSPLGMPFNFLRSVDEFMIPVNIFMAMGLAWILAPLGNALRKSKDLGGSEGQNFIPPKTIPVAIMLLFLTIPAFLIAWPNWKYSNMTHHTFAQDQAKNILGQVEQDGILVVTGDEIFMYEYLQEVREYRTDVDVVESLSDIFTEELAWRDVVFTSNEAAQTIDFLYPPRALRLDGVALKLIPREPDMAELVIGDPNIWINYELRNLDPITLNYLIFDDFEYEVIDRYVNGLTASVGLLDNLGFSQDPARDTLAQMADRLRLELMLANFPVPTGGE